MEHEESIWESLFSGILLVACIFMIGALLLMIAPPDEREVSRTENVTIVERGNGRRTKRQRQIRI